MATTSIEANWPGSGNLFWNPMTDNIERSVGISYAYDTILFAKKGEGSIQMLMYNDYHPRHLVLEAKTGLKGSDVAVKLALSGVVIEKFDLIKEKLDKFEDEVIALGFGRNSLVFQGIFGPNRNRFYHGHRSSIDSAFLGMAISMDAEITLAAVAAEVRTFHDTDLVGSVHTQQVKMTSVTTDQTVIVEAQMSCARGMDKGLGWAKILFADEPIEADRITKINSCFPLALIMTDKNLKHLGVVSAGAFKQIVLHGFKAGEKVKIFVDGTEDLWFQLMPDSKHPCPPTALRVAAGTTIEDLATILGSLTNRHVMVTNTSLTVASHYEFTIIEV